MAEEPQAWSDVPPEEPSRIWASDWEFTLSPYLYASGLDGVVGVGPTSSDVDLEFSDIFENLDAGGIVAFEGRKGRFGFLLDTIWLKLSGSSDTGKRPFSKVDVEVEEVLLSGYLTYRAVANDTFSLDLLAGARYTYIDTTLQLKSPNLRDPEASGSKDWVNPLVGARARWHLTEKWFVNAFAEAGGFGVSSDFAWQAYLGLGYAFNDRVSLQAGWRHIDFDYDRGGFIYDVEMNGLTTGLSFRF